MFKSAFFLKKKHVSGVVRQQTNKLEVGGSLLTMKKLTFKTKCAYSFTLQKLTSNEIIIHYITLLPKINIADVILEIVLLRWNRPVA